PLITPITTGLTMNPVGQPLPPTIKEIAATLPPPLEAPRLRAVMQSRPLPTADAPLALRTTATRMSPTGAGAATAAPIDTANIPRMAAPKLVTVPGAHLEFVRAANAPRPTSLACSGRTLRSVELGWSAGAAHMEAFRIAERDITGAGVTLVAGATHI